MKKLIVLMSLILSTAAFASLDVDDVKKSLAGKYKIITSGGTINVVLRSSGKVMVLNDNDEFEYAEGSMTFNYSNNEWAMNGLPVADLVIGHGSDEDTRDYHVLLTVEEAWDANSENEIRVITTFSTFNDGPNAMSMLEKEKIKVTKYNKKTKKYETLK